MLSTELKQGYTYDFNVIKEASKNKFFKVKSDDDIIFSLQKFKFQHDQPIPDTIKCYVKSLYPLSLGQDISVYIKQFYSEGLDYNFTVKSIKRDPEIIYELEDEKGLGFKLPHSPIQLSKGDRVKCRILKIRNSNVSLKYVSTVDLKFPLKFLDISQWLEILKITRLDPSFVEGILANTPLFSEILVKYEEKDSSWILDLLREFSVHVPDWLIDRKDELKHLRRICRLLSYAKKIALYILEESDFLGSCNFEQRSLLQTKLSNYVDLFEQYAVATERILDKSYITFIDSILRKLKEAGYLFKPSRQIRIMMTILKLRPDVIDSRMGELFEALHNWDITNWKSEPFRAALVQQLQIYIEENAPKINTLPANDSGGENKAVTKMILAIAIQRLLANENDKIDLNHNKALFYRYVSYLESKNVDVLLNKSIESILGMEHHIEYTWDDTENPAILNEKAAFVTNNEEKDSVTKMYSTSKADIYLNSDSLQIIAKNANSETTVIPNGMFDWLNPVISLNDTIDVNIGKKPKDLKVMRKFWKAIVWSLFGDEDAPLKRIEKVIPDTGDEVKIIIDDVRVNEEDVKPKLQFHCTIVDEQFKGDGWLTSDQEHFLGWLTPKDIPGNYDKSLNFATDEIGNPLVFRAYVSRKADGELEFNMKSQIEDHLLETTYTGLEAVAIVTRLDKINNSWLCLSDIGATFKVACDDESAVDMCEGKIVRVRYIEPDRSVPNYQFFIGELSEDQENLPLSFKKQDFLTNLMHSLGEQVDDEDTFTVFEADETLTKEDLLELIYILQRRAYYENEYVKAYNYLALAAILAKMADELSLFEELKIHIDLLELLQEFGKNRNLDSSVLENYEDSVKKIPILERLFKRLKIVSYLNSNDYNSELLHIRNNPRNETEGLLASLVLSYNLIPKDMEASRKEIMKQITTLLNVNSSTQSSKYYGEETQTVEFKSSTVYSTHGGSKPAPREQMNELALIVTGFMNARGGTLYIGVNDSGYENGLDDDLAYRKSHGEKASLDGIAVDLQNYFDRVIPAHAKDRWEIAIDPESRKGVIVVKVAPVEIPVELNGLIYVRSSSTTKPRLDEEREEFIKNRAQNYRLLTKLWGVGESNSDKDEKETVETVHKENTVKSTEKKDNVKINDAKTDFKIKTGRHRPNVLHYYEPNYATPEFYIYINEKGELRTSPEDIYMDTEPDCKVALAVKSKEISGNLILTFDDNSVVKIPLTRIQELNNNQPYLIKDGKKLIQVNIGSDDEYLLSVNKSGNGSLFYRLDSISSISETDNLNEKGIFLCDQPHETIIQEIISKDKFTLYNKDALNRELNFYGVSVPNQSGSLSDDERIEKLLEPAFFRE